jgi:hypothetical protein
MSIIPHHTSDVLCPLCAQKLIQAHPEITMWFHWAKTKHPDLHVSWSYRNQAEQTQAVSNGASRLNYPDSAHNKTDANGNPCSLALDVFQINDAGQAVFDPIFCAKLDAESEAAGYIIKWGGNFRSLGDNDHFEIDVAPPVNSGQS